MRFERLDRAAQLARGFAGRAQACGWLDFKEPMGLELRLEFFTQLAERERAPPDHRRPMLFVRRDPARETMNVDETTLGIGGKRRISHWSLSRSDLVISPGPLFDSGGSGRFNLGSGAAGTQWRVFVRGRDHGRDRSPRWPGRRVCYRLSGGERSRRQDPEGLSVPGRQERASRAVYLIQQAF
jgi:hypothetical protein